MLVLSNMTKVLNITNVGRGLCSVENVCFESSFVWIKKLMIRHSSRVRVTIM